MNCASRRALLDTASAAGHGRGRVGFKRDQNARIVFSRGLNVVLNVRQSLNHRKTSDNPLEKAKFQITKRVSLNPNYWSSRQTLFPSPDWTKLFASGDTCHAKRKARGGAPPEAGSQNARVSPSLVKRAAEPVSRMGEWRQER